MSDYQLLSPKSGDFVVMYIDPPASMDEVERAAEGLKRTLPEDVQGIVVNGRDVRLEVLDDDMLAHVGLQRIP